MIKSIFTVFNPWILLNGTFENIMDYREWEVLISSIIVLIACSYIKEKREIVDRILKQHITIRWGIYIFAVLAIWLFGTYGVNFNAQEFIYGGF